MKKAKLKKLEAELRRARRRIKNLSIACVAYSREVARLNRELYEYEEEKGLHDWAAGM